MSQTTIKPLGDRVLLEIRESAEQMKGGILIPAIFGLSAPLLFPSTFPFSPIAGAALGAVTALFGALGDLVESTFKRSADVKDSGIIVPGRGGILDSLDSLLFAAAPFSILTTVFELI